MELQQILHDAGQPDPTWETARACVQKHLSIPSTLPRLIKSGWEAQMSQADFLKLVGGCRLNAGCLLAAAQIMSDGRKPSIQHVTSALNSLGMGYSGVVIAVNVVTRLFLKSKPPPLWKSLLKDMMSSIEIGYILGSKIPNFGSAGGALMGFADFLGQIILCIDSPKTLKEWRFQMSRAGKLGRKVEVEFFGCEPYQVAAVAVQSLGFGVPTAVGTALGLGRLNPQYLELGPSIDCWKAAILWIEALRRGRDYPPDAAMRDFFSEIAPQKDPQKKNLTLGVLYTEVAKVRSNGSDWTWHLPLPSYDATQDEWDLG